MSTIRYIKDTDHYNEVLSRVLTVRNYLWIGTADIKDLYVKNGTGSAPFLSVLETLIKRGVNVRLLYAKKPGPAFMEEMKAYPLLASRMEQSLCPRVHFKIIVFDGMSVYIGSANLTGAGMGMKGSSKRNFEAGILTDEPLLVKTAMNHFDGVWAGFHCKACGRKIFCDRPLNNQ